MSDRLSIELGRLKEIRTESAAAEAAFERYDAALRSIPDPDDRHDAVKPALCGLIDAIDGEILDEWTWKTITKDEAKSQVMASEPPRRPRL